MPQRNVDAALSGDRSYDDLDTDDQATVRAEWDRRIAEARDALNLEAEFIAEGRTWWVAGDDDGRAVIRHVRGLPDEERQWLRDRFGGDLSFEAVD